MHEPNTNAKSMLTLKRINEILAYQTPSIQRPLDQNHIKRILNDQVKEYERYQSFSILQAITVAQVNNDNTYVLDGQHRIQVFKELQKMNYDISNVILPVVIYKVMDATEMLTYFNMINSNMPIHPIELDKTYSDYSKVLIQNMMQTFSLYIKNDSKNSRCPHINMNDFKKNLMGRDLATKLAPNHTIHELWNSILGFNTYVQQNLKATHQLCPLMGKRIADCEAKATKGNLANVCYLGVWRRYEWLDFALDALLNKKEFKDISLACETTPKQHVPIVVREQVWKKCNPNTGDLGVCYTCCNDLYFRDMECGHVKAHALGGDISVDNLMPVCKSCNKDMGIMDLHEYKSMIEKMSK